MNAAVEKAGTGRFPSLRRVVHRVCQSAGAGLAVIGICLSFCSCALAQLEFERAPINYETAETHDPIQSLQQRLDTGEVALGYESPQGFLAALLEELDIPVSSQMLVFSKTSFQQRRINRHNPRALYFNDDVYVGYVPGGEVLEITAVDPQLGAIFYTLEQDPNQSPRFVRDRGQCLTCHASSKTEGVPGHLVRSVFADAAGQPLFGAGTYTTDHRSPFEQRWGGWFVTGTHGQMRHMGNVYATKRQAPEKLDREAGSNVQNLDDWVNVSPYLEQHSDLVALMILEHQTRVHNLITRANYETRSAIHYDEIMNRALGRPPEHRSESSQRRIEGAGEKLLEGLLFVDEFRLEAPVQGTSSYAQHFVSRGPRDENGRSLRDLDLSNRLMKYPCSYLIYSDAFDQLPAPMLDYVLRRLREILTGQDDSPRYAHLLPADRQAVLEILGQTKANLPDGWL